MASPSRSEPVPDKPSSISKLLNRVECEEAELLEALEVSYDLKDESISRNIREQDVLVRDVMVMAAGLSQKLPWSYNAAMKSNELALWTQECEHEISMLRSMGVWEEVALPVGKPSVSSEWVFNRKSDANSVIVKHKARFVV